MKFRIRKEDGEYIVQEKTRFLPLPFCCIWETHVKFVGGLELELTFKTVDKAKKYIYKYIESRDHEDGTTAWEGEF